MAQLQAPVRNRPQVGDRHKCTLVAEVDGKTLDLTVEGSLREAGIENGTIFTCDDTVTVNGKQQKCGKQWVLHYPTKFAWKARRPSGAKGETAAEQPAAAASTAKKK